MTATTAAAAAAAATAAATVLAAAIAAGVIIVSTKIIQKGLNYIVISTALISVVAKGKVPKVLSTRIL